MTCILHQKNYPRPSLFIQDESCYLGLGDPLELCHQAFSLLRSNSKEGKVRSHTATILRLTVYGMTEKAIHGCHGAHWVGHPIMRFIHPSHVQRLCAGLSEASKSRGPVAIPFVMCMLDPLSTTTTAFHIVAQPANDPQDHHEGGFYCVLFSEQDIRQEQQHQIAVSTFMLLIRQAVAWLSAGPIRILVWLLTILFLQKKKDA